MKLYNECSNRQPRDENAHFPQVVVWHRVMDFGMWRVGCRHNFMLDNKLSCTQYDHLNNMYPPGGGGWRKSFTFSLPVIYLRCPEFNDMPRLIGD